MYNHDGTVGSTTGSIAVQPRPCTENMKIPGAVLHINHNTESNVSCESCVVKSTSCVLQVC